MIFRPAAFMATNLGTVIREGSEDMERSSAVKRLKPMRGWHGRLVRPCCSGQGQGRASRPCHPSVIHHAAVNRQLAVLRRLDVATPICRYCKVDGPRTKRVQRTTRRHRLPPSGQYLAPQRSDRKPRPLFSQFKMLFKPRRQRYADKGDCLGIRPTGSDRWAAPMATPAPSRPLLAEARPCLLARRCPSF